jgi:hypothetical protein
MNPQPSMKTIAGGVVGQPFAGVINPAAHVPIVIQRCQCKWQWCCRCGNTSARSV